MSIFSISKNPILITNSKNIYLIPIQLFKYIPFPSLEISSSSFFIKGAGKVNDYLKEKHDFLQLYTAPIINTLLGTYFLSFAGAVIGSIAAGPIGTKIGGIIGITVGGIIGFVSAKLIINLNTLDEESYQEYFSKQYEKIIKQHKKILESDEKYKEFLCPLTLDFIKVPVKYPDHKTTYEKEFITRWLNDNTTGNNAPTREGHMKKNVLYYDFSYFPRLIKILKSDLDKIFKKNINEIIENRMKQLKDSKIEAINALKHQIFNLEKQEIISKKQCNVTLLYLQKIQNK